MVKQTGLQKMNTTPLETLIQFHREVSRVVTVSVDIS